MEIKGILSESNLMIYKDYIESVSNILNIRVPNVMFYLDRLNKYDDKPKIRGRFFVKEYTIGIALNYDFKNEEDVLITGRHEIAEWLQYVVTKREYDRRNVTHSSDPIFIKLRRAVAKYYLQPQKLANYVKKQMLVL
jgi:hypothetical protein